MSENNIDYKAIIEAARGDAPADLVLAGARIVNVFSGEIEQGDIAVKDGIVIGIGPYEALKRIELDSRYVIPGFIDSHVHIESSMTSVTEFARAVVARGTTTIVADPHEIANVLGTDGITYMLASARNQPMDIYFSLSSCVPATDMETAGARLPAEVLSPLIDHERIVALAEMMNFPGVLAADADVLKKLDIARRAHKRVDGHAPGLSGMPLNAYVAAGIASDHECTTVEEAREKLAAGMHIMVRESTGAKNLETLLPLITPQNSRRMMWSTDDRHPHDLMEEGHIDYIVRRAVAAGLDPITAIQMATINPAEYFGLHDAGAVAPGRKAHLAVLSDLETLNMEMVFSHGSLVATDGSIRADLARPPAVTVPPSMKIDLKDVSFEIPAGGNRIRVIDIVPDQIVTGQVFMEPAISNNLAVSDPKRDLLKIAVVERHTGTGKVGIGFVRGVGLKNGALASSVAHDSHNIIVVGTTDSDMLTACRAVVDTGGGLAVACDGQLAADLSLPIAGLMSDQPVESVRRSLDRLITAARDLGTSLEDPFMTLSFLALPVIPSLKITDRGLVDVDQFDFVPLFVD